MVFETELWGFERTMQKLYVGYIYKIVHILCITVFGNCLKTLIYQHDDNETFFGTVFKLWIMHFSS